MSRAFWAGEKLDMAGRVTPTGSAFDPDESRSNLATHNVSNFGLEQYGYSKSSTLKLRDTVN